MTEHSMSQPDFEAIYDSHYNDVWRYLLHASGEVDAALELTAQTFFRACRAWPRFDHKVPAKAWLLRIAINEWRRELRRRKIRRVIPLPKEWHSHETRVEFDAAEAETVHAELERNESYQSLRSALAKLPEKYRTPITLRYFEYLSMDEIAAILGRPVGTVKSLVHRGIARLREDQGLAEACGESIIEVTRLTVEN
jgi:RNA polymerase sigma-70 factor (ECF subfamily)